MKIFSAAALMLAAGTSLASAGTWTPGVDVREAAQSIRIESGRLTGSLTAKEAARLQEEQEHIRKLEAKAKADGVVTARERERIREAQNVAAQHIRKEKTDGDRR
jgi:uncharacterized membrane protein YebE (DUF533 family)